MSAKTALATETELAVEPSERPVRPPRQQTLGMAQRRVRAAAGSAVADLAAERFRAYRAGDEAALESLVEKLTPLLWHIVRAYGLDTATAEDVVQNTWLTLVRKADTVAEPQAVLRWLTVTARRDAWRAARANGRIDLTEDTATFDLRSTPVDSPEEQVVRTADERALWFAVGKLNERCQRLLRIIAFHDRPDYTALSQELGMPVGSIGPTRGRCLDKLRAELATSASDWSPA
jgi:RNA polymerase sigma factor (sigma-70 family)